MMHIRIGKGRLEVDWPLSPGVTAIYGPSGAGKTLLLECIAGLVTPDWGRILLDDAILFDGKAHLNVPPRRRQCGYVAQRDSLFPHMTLRQNLRFAALAFPRLDRHRRVSEMLDRFQLAGLADSRPQDLSAPQKLRGAVARALIAEPKLLLLDERPVDEVLLRQLPVPVLFVSGDLDLCCAVAAEMILLDAGQIVQRGAPRDVLDRPASIEAARLLGIPNLFEATIAALDPGRGTSRLEFADFSVNASYIPGHFRGDRVWVAIHAADVLVRDGDNSVAVQLSRVSHRAHSVRLEFSGGISADLSLAAWAARKDDRRWRVEFPPDALRIL